MGIDVDGGFAEYVRVAEKMAFKIPEDMPAHIAAFAEPLACVIYASRKINVNPGESVAIIGAGPIGMLFITADEGFRGLSDHLCGAKCRAARIC